MVCPIRRVNWGGVCGAGLGLGWGFLFSKIGVILLEKVKRTQPIFNFQGRIPYVGRHGLRKNPPHIYSENKGDFGTVFAWCEKYFFRPYILIRHKLCRIVPTSCAVCAPRIPAFPCNRLCCLAFLDSFLICPYHDKPLGCRQVNANIYLRILWRNTFRI